MIRFESIECYIHGLIAEKLSIDVASVKSNLHLRDDLGADSLDLAELITTLGSKFEDTVIFDMQVQEIRTVGEIVTYINESQTASVA